MRKNVFVIIIISILLFSCGCSSEQWDRGTSLEKNHSLSEQFSKVPEDLNRLLPTDAYTDEMVQNLSESVDRNDAKLYDLLVENYEQYGRFDGLKMVVWKGAKFFTLLTDEILCAVNYGINQAEEPQCFAIYGESTSNLIVSSLDSYIVDAISDGKKLYVLCSDGKLICIDENKSVKEKVGVFDPSIHHNLVSLSGDSSVLSVVDYSGNVIWSKNINDLLRS